jgi:exonuclease III
MVSPNLKPMLRECTITAEPKFSDHAPFTVDYD